MLDRGSALLGFTVSLELLFTAGILAVGTGLLVTTLQKRRQDRLHARQKARIVRELLLTAIDQRSTMELEFNSEAMHGRKLSGPCSSIENDMTTVDVGLEHNLQTWIGEPVDASFKLAYKDTNTYYHFASRVLGMHAGSWAVSIELAFPTDIHLLQKRQYVRINPLPSHILGMGLWALEPAQPLPLDSTSLGCASLSYRPGKLTQCSLLNLSAGGMRMEVPQVLLTQIPAHLTLQAQLLCLLLLRSPDSDHPMPFWLACAIVSLMEDMEDASNVIIGVKFKAWALSAVGSSDIFWFPVGKAEEVPPLASWVLRHQLEQNKRRE
jgi:c-di-GMP-binding flagellar brake protein YcgR